MFFLRCFCPVWVLVRVFQKMQKISTLGRLSVLMIKIRKSVEKDWKSFNFQSKLFGGDKRDRTADLMTASHALSQLSYTPIGESYSNRFRRKMQVFSRENLKITAMTENTVRASAFWQKNRVRFCENGVCQTARICDKIQKTAIGCWQNACFRYDVPKQDQRRKEDCT